MSTLVFGRAEYAEPLVQLGETDDEDVRRAFPGEWIELVAVPQDRVVWIVRGEQEIGGARDFARARE